MSAAQALSNVVPLTLQELDPRASHPAFGRRDELRRITLVHSNARAAEASLRVAIREAADAGCTWPQIAAALRAAA